MSLHLLTFGAMRSLTLIESVVAVSVLGSVAAVFVPAFVKDLRASRLSEPLDGLKHISARATALALERPAQKPYPASVGLTPAEVPKGESVADREGTWSHPTWQALEFGFDRPHYYSFSFESQNKPNGSHFVARAHGDLDGDGIHSRFEIHGSMKPNEEPQVSAIEMDREIE